MSRTLPWLGAAAIGVVDLLPLAVIAKQALTPEAESFAWPPRWWPGQLTAANFRSAWSSAELGSGLMLSAEVAVATAVVSLALAAPAAWSAARRPRQQRLLDATLVFARILPTVAIAVPLASLFVSWGLYNRPSGSGLVLAHTLLALPVAFLVLRAGMRDLPSSILEAARLDGALGWRLGWHVILPLLRPSLAAAAMLVFLASWDEFGYAVLLQVTNRPLPPLLYYLASYGYPGQASALAVVMLAPALLVVLLLEPALRAGLFAGSER